MKLSNTMLAIFVIVFIISLTLSSLTIINKLENYQLQLTGKSTAGQIRLNVGLPEQVAELVPSPAPSGGAGGGGGGRVSKPLEIIEEIPIENIEKIFEDKEGSIILVKKIEANKEIIIPIGNPFLSIQTIKLTLKAAEDVKITVKELNPKEIEEILSYDKNRLESAVYKFAKIIAVNGNGEQLKIDSAKIVFYLEKNWLEKYNIEEEEIRLSRLRNGKWSYLETKKIGDTAEHAYYEAVTAELSIFAITYEKPFEEPIDEIKEEFPIKIPEKYLTLVESLSLALIVALLVLFNVLYLHHRRKLNKLQSYHRKKLEEIEKNHKDEMEKMYRELDKKKIFKREEKSLPRRAYEKGKSKIKDILRRI